MSAPDFPPTITDSAQALKQAAVASLRARGLTISDTKGRNDAEQDTAPHATLALREECGCGLPNNHHEFTLSIHVRGFDFKPREVMRLTDEAERAALTLGTHLRDWQVLQISAERTRILRQAGGDWAGCLSVRALLSPKD
ncbi:hypothetical protein FG91_02198 [Sphingopyxis sp. LC81]|uniref:hypothetical protein n=1 Tax=Sphingopyxis sp. LC81 TaxID=1502850 RepID=UPI00051057F1|nr:hypothetical protein [Sphingopyxis sp. LC81]KGB53953.1 hypothetical protein FG91_02198 [Sphingopyxis sp. LC81]